ncbi:MAG TPA: hypothetical protein VLX31_02235 [Streptosporangiaceae bacterium]|nr:hypothetical protein [Streptosporangiaceae bacterium]
MNGRTVLRPLPAWGIGGWNGLRRFLRMTIRNTSGKIVGSTVMTFCPDSSNPQRTSPNSPANSLFPTECSDNPFEKGMVWGVQRGWGVDPIASGIVVIQPGGGASPFDVEGFSTRHASVMKAYQYFWPGRRPGPVGATPTSASAASR